MYVLLEQPWMLGLMAGLATAVATWVGAFVPFLPGKNGFKIQRYFSFDFALGMMLAAAAFSLILPAARDGLSAGVYQLGLVVASLLLGIYVMTALEFLFEKYDLHHNKVVSVKSSKGSSELRPVLFILAMMLHNFPEGLASGAAFAGLGLQASLPVVGSIMLQNLPEGLAIVLAFLSLGMSKKVALAGGVLSGVVELIGGVVGGVFIGITEYSLPFVLAFAGGAMMKVVLQELLHKIRKKGVTHLSTKPDFLVGFFLVFLVI